ncbi:MAG: hypothetical protein M3157_02575 [Actinomycetota bacterium]|nr:hypothetical protein [Actinomycetota bacterium]
MKTSRSRYNEIFEEDGTPRELYTPLMEIIENLGSEALADRPAAASERLREMRATFPLPDDSEEKERLVPADWVPRIIPADHWQRISAGVLQRGKALNA